MTESIAKALNMEDIFKSFPASTRMQPKYRAKVVFLNTQKSDPTYSPVRVFSVNGNKYSVVDSGIAFMPKEAFSALSDAVGFITKPKNAMQKEYGLNADDLNDKYEKVPVPNYDLTILEEYYPVEKGGQIVHLIKDEYVAFLKKEKELEELKTKPELSMSASEIKKKERQEKAEDDKEKKNFAETKSKIKTEAEVLTDAMLREE